MYAIRNSIFSFSKSIFFAVAQSNDIWLWVSLVLSVSVCVCVCECLAALQIPLMQTFQWTEWFETLRQSVRWWPYADEISAWNKALPLHSFHLDLTYSQANCRANNLQSSPIPPCPFSIHHILSKYTLASESICLIIACLKKHFTLLHFR